MTPTNSENTRTIYTLAARLVGNPDTKKVKKQLSIRVLTPEEKTAFHARMAAAKLPFIKSSFSLPPTLETLKFCEFPQFLLQK